jgi:hypothetical protein
LELIARTSLEILHGLSVAGRTVDAERIGIGILSGLTSLQIRRIRPHRTGERSPERVGTGAESLTVGVGRIAERLSIGTGRAGQAGTISTRRVSKRGIQRAGAGAERARERIAALAEKRR